MNDTKQQRIFEELKAVGVTRHGLAKPESRELVRLLHDDEHIGGAVYGPSSSGSSAMLVATDHRVLFLDNEFLFKTADELTYDIVSGVTSSTAGPFSSVVLHTRIADYTLRYVNVRCAKTFIRYIETQSLEKKMTSPADTTILEQPAFEPMRNTTAAAFLEAHDLAVLSTVDRTGNVHGAVVYYAADQQSTVYLLTKSDTGKGRNIYAHSQVALTIHEPGTLKTLQLQGIANVETDQAIKEDMLVRLSQPRSYSDGVHPPPVTRLQNGSFIVIRITPLHMSYHDYAAA